MLSTVYINKENKIMNMFEQLKSEGIKYILIPKRAKKKFYAVKQDLKTEALTDDSDVFTYSTEGKEEKELLKALPKDIWVKISED